MSRCPNLRGGICWWHSRLLHHVQVLEYNREEETMTVQAGITFEVSNVGMR